MKWFALIAPLLIAGAQDKKTVEVKFRPVAGDRIRFEEVRSMVLHDPPFTAPRGAKRGGDYSISKRMTGSMELNEVKDGRLVRKTVEVQEHVKSDKMPWEKEPVIEKGPLHQRKFTVQEAGGKLSHQGVHGLDDATLRALTMMFGNEYVELLPPGPVRSGDDWKIVDKDPGIPQGEVKFETGFIFMTLKDVRMVDERRCAVITLEQETSSLLKPRDGKEALWIDTFQKGELVVWLDRGYALSMTVKGQVKVKAKRGAEEIDAEGETSYELTETIEAAK